MEQCPKCGNNEIDRGRLKVYDGALEIAYGSENKKLFRHDAKINAFVCTNCGYTEIYSDIIQLKKTIKSQS